MLGTLINERYLLQAQIGEGGMATVYMAEDKVTKGKVALKIISSALLDKPELLKRFKREFSACSKVKHKNVISLFDMGVTQVGAPFYTMEFLPHPSLADVIKDIGPMDDRQALLITIQLTRALAHCHGLGVIHRDVKPDNIIVTPEGRLLLVDFGLAADAEQTALTADGAILGTPHYMAPEVVKGQPATEAADIYAVGAVAYEMLAGHRPIVAESLQEAMMAILCGQIEPIAQLRENLPSQWSTVIAKAMALEAKDRFGSMNELLQSLGQLWQLYVQTEEKREKRISSAKEQLEQSVQSFEKQGLLANRYKILRKLGEGGMAIVYEAEDRDENRVAIKVMSSALTEVDGLTERFDREFTTCQKLSSPNIVKLYDKGTLPSGQPYYTMEYLPFPSIEDILQSTVEPLDEERIQSWMVQLAKAMCHYEGEGILHRDIKGANVIITDEERLVLVDFGLAYDESASKLTRTGAILGTPYFLAPELLTGNRPTIASDIYAVGVLMYECLTGSLPFKSKTMESLLISILNGEYVPLEEVRGDLSPRWAPIVGRCLARKPAARYGSPKELLDDLQGKKVAHRAKKKIEKKKPRESPKSTVVEPKEKNGYLFLILTFLLLGSSLAFLFSGKNDVEAKKPNKRPVGSMKLEKLISKKVDKGVDIQWHGLRAEKVLLLKSDGREEFIAISSPSSSKYIVHLEKVDEGIEDIRLMVQRGSGMRKLSLRELLRKESSKLSDALQSVDTRILMAAKLKPGNTKAQLEELLQQTSMMDEYERAVELSPLVLSTSLLSFEQRNRFHDGLMRIWTFYVANAVRKDRVHLSIPCPYLGAYAISNKSAGKVVKELTLLDEYVRIGEKPLVRRPEAPIQRCEKTFSLVDLPSCTGCELMILTDNGLHDGAMSVDINGRYDNLCYGSPVIPKLTDAPSDQVVYLRLPLKALRVGENNIVLRNHALYRGRSTRTVGVRKITLRFLQ